MVDAFWIFCRSLSVSVCLHSWLDVCLCLSVCLSSSLSFGLSVCLSVGLTFCLSVCLSVSLSICLFSVSLSAGQSVFLFFFSLCWSLRLSSSLFFVYLSVNQSINQSIKLINRPVRKHSYFLHIFASRGISFDALYYLTLSIVWLLA